MTSPSILEWCNQVRARRDQPPLTELPLGQHVPGAMTRSPVEVATGSRVVLGTLQLIEGDRLVVLDTPDSVLRFIDRYRSGLYPELVPNRKAP